MSKKAWIVIAVACILLAAAFFLNRLLYPPKDEIVIGAIFDLTGSLSYMGQWSLEGAKLAEQDINAGGGINGKMVRLQVDDAETNPQKAATIFQRFISVNHLPVVLGFNGSSEVMAAAPIANASHVILFSTGGASPGITEAGEFVFRNRLSGAVEASRMAEIAYDKLGLRNGAILFIQTDYGQGYSEAFRSRFAGLGGMIRATEGFAQDQTDFRAQLAKIRSLEKIDFVYIASHEREAGNILKQAKEQGFSTRWLASNAVEGPDLFQIAGDGANGLLLTVAQYDPNSIGARAFNESYKKAYSRDSEMFAAHAYDGVRIIAKLIAEVGYEGDRIKTALYDLRDYPGVSGMTSFDRNGDVIKAVGIKIAKDGKFQEIPESSLERTK
jgi:branched-chain amino acid transport system substrate-binding protein